MAIRAFPRHDGSPFAVASPKTPPPDHRDAHGRPGRYPRPARLRLPVPRAGAAGAPGGRGAPAGPRRGPYFAGTTLMTPTAPFPVNANAWVTNGYCPGWVIVSSKVAPPPGGIV